MQEPLLLLALLARQGPPVVHHLALGEVHDHWQLDKLKCWQLGSTAVPHLEQGGREGDGGVGHQGVRGEGALVVDLHVHAPGSRHQEAVDRLVPLGLLRAVLENIGVMADYH